MTESLRGVYELQGMFHQDWDLDYESWDEVIEDFARSRSAYASAAVTELANMAEQWSEKRIRKEIRVIVTQKEAAKLPQPRWKNAALTLRERIIAAQRNYGHWSTD
ncbi:hypothetical protein F4561_004445 [Lipingzhangella halophila]|uniref:CdiI immunity protein domain-containing protein n=1 Tax=Lipingzhangella halophila TaxID=1783352 RepID=A0A7W7RKH6_9ACTN|nr:contact-dependent growth inhibition system immunity protein [Lipingzhangella halophila]MBB4933625.1 hypothetical protein [Lipingzhangella halophila]